MNIIIKKNILRYTILFEFAVIFFCILLYEKKSWHISNEYGAYSKDAKELYAMIKENTPNNAKIIFFKPRVLYLETGRLGFQTSDINRLKDADYLVLSTDGYGTFDYDIESQYPEESRLVNKVFENKSLKCYEIRKDFTNAD